MNFIQHDLGNRQKGDVVEVTLSGAANVRLMDTMNFSHYKRGEKYQYLGGLAKQSIIRIAIPSSGHWFVAVDMLGLRGSVKSSARVL